jgi:cellulose synthase/poly-beta-1,6-N-acetylglucosamine synthase-like glycosyltransferase
MLESGWNICHATPSLQRALPDRLAREQKAVVLADDGDGLVIATADPSEHGLAGVATGAGPSGYHGSRDDTRNAREALLDALESRRQSLSNQVSRPVRLEMASEGEIALALAESHGDRSVESMRVSRLRALVDDCGLKYVLTGRSGKGSDATVNDILDDLVDGWGPELLGLLEGLPHLLPSDPDFDPALCVLTPPSVRSRWDVDPIVPWGFEEGCIVFGCVRKPNEASVRAIDAWTGMRTRFVLCEAPELQRAIDAHRSGRPSGDPASGASSPFGRVRETALAVLGEARNPVRPADQVEPVDASTLAGRGQTRSNATALRTRSAAQGDGPAGQASLGAIPAAMARSLSIVPIMGGHDVLTLGIVAGHPEAESIRRAMSLLSGCRVRLHEMNEERLRGAQARHYKEGEAWRLVSPWRGRRSVDNAAGSARRSSTVAQGYHARDGMQALHTSPFIRLEFYACKPDVIRLIPRNLLEFFCAVPLRREGLVLWVAMAASTVDACRTLALASGMAIRAVAASEEAIRDRLRACAVSARALDLYQAHPVVDFLQQQGRLVGAQLLQHLNSPDTAVDQALVQAGVLDFEEFSELASRLCALPRVNLRHTGRLEETYFESESRVRVHEAHEVVDPQVASMIPVADARTFGILSIRREHILVDGELPLHARSSDGALDSCVVVAVADPCLPEVASTAAAIGHAAYRLVIAPRPDILAAIARADGSAQLGERLVLSGVVSEANLERAVRLHTSSGVRLGQALIHLNLISQEQLAFFLAEQLDLPFVGLKGIRIDEELARQIPEQDERRLGILPLYEAGAILVAVMPDPLDFTAREEAEAMLGRPVQAMICTEADFEGALESLYRDLYLERSSADLATRSPEESASRVVTRPQVAVFAAIGVVSLVLLWRLPLAFGVGAAAVSTLLYAAFSIYRGYLIYRSLSHDLEIPVSDEELASLDEATLPIYTVLVPLYREASVLPTLVAGLARLDYPPTKLDVKLLLEEDDRETLDAVASMHLPAYVHPVVVPAAKPRGKPKACNYGLIHARGEYVVIYDAEDVPDPDQLKKAVLGFRKIPEDVVCLQAKLSYYNADQNLLTRWFAIEYSVWFDLFLPGLDASGAPVPLGGTSNHFRVPYLLEVGAWDPYNVTEDADLGVRLYRRGWRTAVIESTTYEEATSEVYNWVRQRSRWVKGYVQTYLVHMRHPVELCKSMGFKGFLSFNLVVGGTFFGLLMNPILWCLTALWYGSHAHFIRDLFPAPVFYLGALSLVIGNTAFIYLNVAGCLRPGMYDKVKYALLSPLYWALMSLAAWKGFIQLWSNPFYWEKTVHGRYRVTNQPESTDVLNVSSPVTQQIEAA